MKLYIYKQIKGDFVFYQEEKRRGEKKVHRSRITYLLPTRAYHR